MKQAISFLKNIHLRQIVTIFLVVLSFLFSTAFDFNGNLLSAQAASVSSEATGYKANNEVTDAQKAERVIENAEKSAKLLEAEGIKVTNRAAESAKDPDRNVLENIKEKLNLDEPIDPGTKLAGEQIKEGVSKAVKAPQKALKDAVD